VKEWLLPRPQRAYRVRVLWGISLHYKGGKKWRAAVKRLDQMCRDARRERHPVKHQDEVLS
jgi:hypothetical protein